MNAKLSIDLPQLKPTHGQLADWTAGLAAARAELLTLIADLPKAALTWQPLLTSQSIGALLLHIADTEAFWLAGQLDARQLDDRSVPFLWNDASDLVSPAAPPAPLNWYLDQLAGVRADSLRRLSQLPSLDHICTREINGQSERFAWRWLVWHLIEHETHHRGQIALLKRWYQEAHAPVYA